MKSLIAYFSRKGDNYVGGRIVNLPIGNTETAAKMIQKLTDGDVFKIATLKEYPSDYHECTEEARKELRQNARPELSGRVEHDAQGGIRISGSLRFFGQDHPSLLHP